jgi:hypothetical protein
VQRNDPLDLQAACLAIQLDMLVISFVFTFIIYIFYRKKPKQFICKTNDTTYSIAYINLKTNGPTHSKLQPSMTEFTYATLTTILPSIWKVLAKLKRPLTSKYMVIQTYPQFCFSFEKSQTHHFEVPRMLADEPKAVDLYVKRKRDR